MNANLHPADRLNASSSLENASEHFLFTSTKEDVTVSPAGTSSWGNTSNSLEKGIESFLSTKTGEVVTVALLVIALVLLVSADT